MNDALSGEIGSAPADMVFIPVFENISARICIFENKQPAALDRFKSIGNNWLEQLTAEFARLPKRSGLPVQTGGQAENAEALNPIFRRFLGTGFKFRAFFCKSNPSDSNKKKTTPRSMPARQEPQAGGRTLRCMNNAGWEILCKLLLKTYIEKH